MYTGFLHLHNFLRWLIVIAGFICVIMAFRGWSGKRKWTNLDNILGVTFASLLDLQLVIGLVLYFFVSPVTKAAFNQFGAAMKDENLRFYAVEHILMMVIAIVVVHLGRNKLKKAGEDVARHRISAIFHTIGLILILAAIPWNRPMF